MSGNWRSNLAALALIAPAPVFAAEPTAALVPAPPPIFVIGSAYFAKQLCSCLFVVGRPELSCRAEFKPRIDAFRISIDRDHLPAAASVAASIGPVSALATFNPRYGCVLAK